MAVLLARDESQLRRADRQQRWAQEDGIWLLRTARSWLPRDLEVLRPVFERMRAEGPDFLKRNAAVADDVRRTLVEIDEIESQLKKAETAIGKARELTAKHRTKLAGLCDVAAVQQAPVQRADRKGNAHAGNGNGNRGGRLSEFRGV